MTIKDLFKMMLEKDASDLFCRVGCRPHMRIDGKITPIDENILDINEVNQQIKDITSEAQREKFKQALDIDFAVYLESMDCRFRVSLFTQRHTPSLVIRRVRNYIASFEDLNLPADVLKKLAMESRGLILLTGSAGSGKSTTIASMIEYINNNAHKHILTVEEPIEFTFKDKNSLINQRELGLDVENYNVALKAFTLQSPDVIFIGNIRNSETMAAAITAAETGVLVLSTLHTINAHQTVERIVNFFPPHQHMQIRTQLSFLLKGVISLRLIPRKDGKGRIPAYEAMLLTPTITRLIREGKDWELPHFIEEGALFGMQTFTQSLVKLVREGKVTQEDAMNFADNRDELGLAIKGVIREK
jgi:twitching motility protein PilT